MSGLDHVGKLRRVCDVCGAPVHHPPKRGRPRRYCDDDCAREVYNAQKRELREEFRQFRAQRAETQRREFRAAAQGLVAP